MAVQVPLAEALEVLRSELETVMSDGDGRALRFEARSIDLELQVAVTAAGKGKAGIKWWLVEAGAEGSLERKTTQIVRLSLVPVEVPGPGQPARPARLDGKD